jgi:hypothetical protein
VAIPRNITRAHVQKAIQFIDRSGVPQGRESRGYVLRAEAKSYPPKYVLAVANSFANRRELTADEFSGGAATNVFLESRGFEIVKRVKERRLPAGPGPRVATAILECGSRHNLQQRLEATRVVVRNVATAAAGNNVVMFSGAWFYAGGGQPNAILGEVIWDVLRGLRRDGDSRIAVTFGVDGRRHKDQLGVALDARGAVVGMARKFYPTREEKGKLAAAASWDAKEDGFPRIAMLFGRRFFLAVCYDAFGIKKRHLRNPGVDAVLDHVHLFNPRGTRNSGDVLFARHGLGGASRQWGIPVFAAVRFVKRTVPEKWPSGVLWKGTKSRSTLETAYARIAIPPERTLLVPTVAGRCVVRIFPPLNRAT